MQGWNRGDFRCERALRQRSNLCWRRLGGLPGTQRILSKTAARLGPEMKANRWLVVLFAFFCATPYVLHMHQWLQWKNHSTERPRPTVASLTARLRELPFAERITTVKSFDRDSSVGVTGMFDSDMPPLQIVAALKVALSKTGWVIKQERREPYVSLFLCREGIAATIEPSTTPGGTRTYVGITWTYHTAASNYCPL